MQNKTLGILYAMCGVFILSFDSVLVRMIDTSPWTLIFWRGILLSTTITILTLCTRKTAQQQAAPFSIVDVIGGVAFATSTLFFVLSVSNTDAASTLAIFNTAPFFAAVIAFITMKEKLAIHTLVAMGVSISGIAIIFDHGLAVGQALGDYYALVAAIGSACYLVSLRKSRGVNSHTILIIGGLTMAVIALINGATPSELNQIQFSYMAILGIIVVPLSGLCIAKSSQYLPAAQTALILLLELLLGPLWVFLALDEQPATANLIGGSIVLIALTVHSIWERLCESKAPLATSVVK